MSTEKIVNGEVVHELSVRDFEVGLFQLAGENDVEYKRLIREFRSVILEEVIKTTEGKSKGKPREQIVFERLKRREARKHYKNLAKNLRNAKITRPVNTAGHHIVSWHDVRAEDAREILRQFGIEIDSQYNGVYLPLYKKHVPHKSMPKAYPHTTIHTGLYYVNVTSYLVSQTRIEGTTKEDIIDVLREIAEDLRNGSFPLHQSLV